MRHAPENGEWGTEILLHRTLCNSMADDPDIAWVGATITCQACLSKLHEFAQYATVLMKAGYVIGKRRAHGKRKRKVDPRQLDIGESQ